MNRGAGLGPASAVVLAGSALAIAGATLVIYLVLDRLGVFALLRGAG